MPDATTEQLKRIFEASQMASDLGGGQTFENLIPKFIDYLQYELTASKDTIVKYRNNLRLLQRDLSFLASPVELKLEHVTQLKKATLGRGAGACRVNSIVFSLRKFLSFCREVHELQTINPKEIKPMRVPKREVTFLSVDEIRQLLESFNTRDVREVRMRALMEILLATGMRISEALSLNRSDLKGDSKEVAIIGKGDKQRTVFVNDRALYWIREYLSRRSDAAEPLFVAFGDNHARLNRYDLGKQFRHYAKRAGILKKVTPHILRHTMATLLLKNGCNIKHIQELLGHSDIETTARYYLGTDKEALRESHAKFLRFD
jgi:integrase/recombinase XerD